ncbi:MAG: hypothetical protein ABIE22_01920 [archaeon]
MGKEVAILIVLVIVVIGVVQYFVLFGNGEDAPTINQSGGEEIQVWDVNLSVEENQTGAVNQTGGSNQTPESNQTLQEESEVIEIRYFSLYPGEGSYEYFIINNSGKFVGITSKPARVSGGSAPKKVYNITFDELWNLYQRIGGRGFWTLDTEYWPSWNSSYSFGNSSLISVRGEGDYKEVDVFDGLGPGRYYEVVTEIMAEFPMEVDCALEHNDDFPNDNLDNAPCPDNWYYFRYRGYCVCL